MRDVKDAGRMFLCGSAPGDEDPAGVGDNVRIGEEPIGADHEAGTGTAAEATRIPGGAVIGDLSGDFDTHNRPVGVCRAGGRSGLFCLGFLRERDRGEAGETAGE